MYHKFYSSDNNNNNNCWWTERIWLFAIRNLCKQKYWIYLCHCRKSWWIFGEIAESSRCCSSRIDIAANFVHICLNTAHCWQLGVAESKGESTAYPQFGRSSSKCPQFNFFLIFSFLPSRQLAPFTIKSQEWMEFWYTYYF